MAQSKVEDAVFLAKLAEQAERYEGMRYILDTDSLDSLTTFQKWSRT